MAVACTSSGAISFPANLKEEAWQRTRHSLLRSSISSRRSVWPPRASSGSGSRRYPNVPPETVVVVSDGRGWREIKALNGEEEYGMNGDYDDDEEEEEEDRSLDLLVRFLHNVFRNFSRRVRKAVRSVLPVPISTQLVGFAVDGMLILAFLWILKAFLEVVCTLGSMVFVSILLVRGVWLGVSYFQEIRTDERRRFNNDDDQAWSGVQAAT